MSHNMEGGNERSEMIKKVEEASKLNPERLKKVDGNCFRIFFLQNPFLSITIVQTDAIIHVIPFDVYLFSTSNSSF